MKATKLIFGLFAVASVSCDRDFDLFKMEQISVAFNLAETGESLPLTNGVLKDSIKRSQKHTYTIDLKGGSDANNIEIKRNGKQEILAFYLNDSLISSVVAVARGQNNISVEGIDAGNSTGTISVTDVYGHTSDIPYDFTVFYNLPPVCRVSVTNIKELSPYEITIDLSASYDADEKFGGYIDQYEYRIGSYYKLNTTQPLIYHIFPTFGNYEIRCRVRDNNGAWSDFALLPITIEDI